MECENCYSISHSAHFQLFSSTINISLNATKAICFVSRSVYIMCSLSAHTRHRSKSINQWTMQIHIYIFLHNKFSLLLNKRFHVHPTLVQIPDRLYCMAMSRMQFVWIDCIDIWIDVLIIDIFSSGYCIFVHVPCCRSTEEAEECQCNWVKDLPRLHDNFFSLLACGAHVVLNHENFQYKLLYETSAWVLTRKDHASGVTHAHRFCL